MKIDVTRGGYSTVLTPTFYGCRQCYCYAQMLVLIDESGDCGFKFGAGSSDYFIVTAVIFADNLAASSCDRCIDAIRRTLKLAPNYEFHFSRCSDKIRTAFFHAAASEEFFYYAFALNKALLFGKKFSDPQGFYDFAVLIVCDNAGPLLQNAKVIIDKCGDREFQRRLSKRLKSAMNTPEICRVKKVSMEGSHTNNLVQLADMVCGAVARSVVASKADPGAFRTIRAARERRVQLWPKK
jgi:hypothetical protein